MDNTENKIKNFSEWAEKSLTNRCESKKIRLTNHFTLCYG